MTDKQNATADKAVFEAHYRKECGMPDQAEFQWTAPYMVAALDGWNAKAAHVAMQAAGDVERLTADVEWHKEALKRHADKLVSVWAGMAEMMQKTIGHQCSAEPFNDLEALLLELKSARASLAASSCHETLVAIQPGEKMVNRTLVAKWLGFTAPHLREQFVEEFK